MVGLCLLTQIISKLTCVKENKEMLMRGKAHLEMHTFHGQKMQIVKIFYLEETLYTCK